MTITLALGAALANAQPAGPQEVPQYENMQPYGTDQRITPDRGRDWRQSAGFGVAVGIAMFAVIVGRRRSRRRQTERVAPRAQWLRGRARRTTPLNTSNPG